MPLTRELLERGRDRYRIFCTPCHGMTGDGRGIVVQRGYRQPPTFNIDRLRAAPVGYFFDVQTNGFGAMMDYAAQIPAADRWAIAAYLRALQLSQSATLADVPPESAAPSTAPRPRPAPRPSRRNRRLAQGPSDRGRALESAGRASEGALSWRRRAGCQARIRREADAARRRPRRGPRRLDRIALMGNARPVLPLLPPGLRLLERPGRGLARHPHAPVPDGRRVGHRDPPRRSRPPPARCRSAPSSSCRSLFGMHRLYEWTHADVVAKDELLRKKTLYLNSPSSWCARPSRSASGSSSRTS